MQNIYWFVNIAIIAVYVIAMAGAYRRGFLFEGINLFLTLISLFVSWQLAPILAKRWPLIKANYFSDILFQTATPYINILIWLLIILAIFKFINLFITPLFKKVSTVPFVGFFNRFLGLFIGFLHATFWVFLLSMLLALPFIPNGRNIREKTLLAPINHYANQTIYFLMKNVNVQEIQSEVDKLTSAFAIWLEKQDLPHE